MRILFLCCLLSCFNCFAQSLAPVPESWSALDNGLELYVTQDKSSKFNVIKLKKQRHGIKVLRAQDYGKRVMSASEVCTASGALMCINASFFDENQVALGLIVSSGILFQKVHQGGETLNGILSFSRKGFQIEERNSFNKQIAFEAIQAGPILLLDAENLKEKYDKNYSRRSAVCLNEQGEALFFVSADQPAASSLSELANFMKTEPFNCKQALNLDGGGSSQLFLKSKSSKTALENIALDIAGQDKVPVFLGVVEGMPF